MATSSGDRAAFFPAIEKKHGKPINHWLTLVKKQKNAKYPELISLLRETHGFSQAHANAVVLYARGSTSSKKFDDVDGYFASIPETHARAAQAILAAVRKKYPRLKVVLAWNQPMLRTPEGQYVFGLSASKNHLTLNPFSQDVLAAHSDRLSSFVVNKSTFQVPVDWKINTALLQSLVRTRLAELR